MHISELLDYYLTANTVTADKRQSEHLFSLNNIAIDIDCHDEKLTSQEINALVEAVIWRAKRDYWDKDTFPQPNSIVRTGRGVQFWWAIKPCAMATVWFYNQIKGTFLRFFAEMVSKHKELNEIIVDTSPSKNNVGFFRLPCTYNTVAKKYGSLEILHRESYDTHNLFKIVKPNLPKKSSKPKSRKRTASVSHKNKPAVALEKNDINFLEKCDFRCGRRVAKFIQLRNIRGRDIGAESRDLLCLIVYCELRKVYDHDQALNFLRQFNDGFKEPFDDERLQKKISSAKEVCYTYSNAKIIEVLEITPEEQSQINFYPADPMGWTKRRPNASRDEVRKVKREGRDAKIIELYSKGLSRVEIGRELGINRKTAAAVINKWIESTNTTKEGGDQKEFLKCNCVIAAPQEGDLTDIQNIQESTAEENHATCQGAHKKYLPTAAVTVAPIFSLESQANLAKPILCVYKADSPPDSS